MPWRACCARACSSVACPPGVALLACTQVVQCLQGGLDWAVRCNGGSPNPMPSSSAAVDVFGTFWSVATGVKGESAGGDGLAAAPDAAAAASAAAKEGVLPALARARYTLWNNALAGLAAVEAAVKAPTSGEAVRWITSDSLVVSRWHVCSVC